VRWSQTFIPTLKEVPQDAEIPSHQLLLRAGLMRKLHSGLFTFLPLGLRALRKVSQIIREEMDRAGAIEILMPALHPQELWERTGRLTTMKDVMFTFKDRADRPLLLGPTHEEVVTDLAAREISSYRQLPVNFYQIQTKFRDEIRPRFGLMRAKEFVMKDAYSFDTDWDGASRSYQAMYDAYVRIFKRCGLVTKPVEADTGAMGGNQSHEFMVITDAGEDGLVECDACSYAANLERAEGVSTHVYAAPAALLPVEKIATPTQRTIQEVADFLKADPKNLLKTLVYEADGALVAVVLPGDREVNEIKLRKALGANAVALAADHQVRALTGATPGFVGPVGLTGVKIVCDRTAKGLQDGVTGANEDGHHIVHVSLERDVKVDLFADIAMAREGDRCPSCGGTLRVKRGVEVGHVFKLGTKYSEALGATFLDEAGQSQVAIMGCYGIGVSRTLQAVVEQSHDKDGIRWPVSIAPFQVHAVLLTPQDAASREAGDRAVAALEALGVEVLYDDRDERPGFKFKDADLIGLPIRLTIGGKSLARGVAEVKIRGVDGIQEVPVAEAPARVAELVREQLAALNA
jgi:prolyl-tRNA synthetase